MRSLLPRVREDQMLRSTQRAQPRAWSMVSPQQPFVLCAFSGLGTVSKESEAEAFQHCDLLNVSAAESTQDGPSEEEGTPWCPQVFPGIWKLQTPGVWDQSFSIINTYIV